MTIVETGPHKPKSVFVIHGRELNQKEQLKELISVAGATPVVLQDDTEATTAIISKFEVAALTCSCAIAILTPDDEVLAHAHDVEKFRARQNVIFEIGWFAGRLGRHRVLMLYKGKLDIPSDLLGVDHLSFKVDAQECGERVRRFLEKMGAVA